MKKQVGRRKGVPTVKDHYMAIKRQVMARTDLHPDERAALLLKLVKESPELQVNDTRSARARDYAQFETILTAWPDKNCLQSLEKTAMMPSALQRAMLLLGLNKRALGNLAGTSNQRVTEWLQGHSLVTPVVTAYFMLRGNEIVRAWAHGFGFGVVSDVDVLVSKGVSEDNLAAIISGGMPPKREPKYPRKNRLKKVRPEEL